MKPIRKAEGAPLGAKGLFPELYLAMEEECERRGNLFLIHENPTDWMTLKHPSHPKGVYLSYRIPDGIAEIRMLASYKGDRHRIQSAVVSPVCHVVSGGDEFYRHSSLRVSDEAKAGHLLPEDAVAIVDAFEELHKWWCTANEMAIQG